MVIAASGVLVSKHGNRAASSKSGTADCLEALGVNIALDTDKCRELLDKAGFCFFFAQKYHTSMKYVGSIRKELGFRTVFNILGPLTNPAHPKRHLLGVYDEVLLVPVAEVLMKLGLDQAWLGVEGFAANVVVTVVVIILNYVLSKFLVFRKKEN